MMNEWKNGNDIAEVRRSEKKFLLMRSPECKSSLMLEQSFNMLGYFWGFLLFKIKLQEKSMDPNFDSKLNSTK